MQKREDCLLLQIQEGVGAPGAPVLVLTGYLLPEDFKEAQLIFAKEQKT